jgi:hypothetical protein
MLRLFLWLALCLPSVAHADGAVCATPSCAPGSSEFGVIELDSKRRKEYLEALPQQVIAMSLRSDLCWYRNQSVFFYAPNEKGLPIYWGQGHIENLLSVEDGESEDTKLQEPNAVARTDVMVKVHDKLLSKTLLAPVCGAFCTKALLRLPSSKRARIIDTRPSRIRAGPAIPGSIRFDDTPARLTTQVLGNDYDARIVFVPLSSLVNEASATLELMKKARSLGYRNVEWFYPGYQGLRGRELPERPLSGVQIVSLHEARTLIKNGAVVVYVDNDLEPIPTTLADGTRIRPAPYKSRRGSERIYDLSKLPSGNQTPLLFVQQDGARVKVYEAALQAIKTGRRNVAVLPGGVFELEAR